MNKASSEKIKLYVVIALSVVAAALAYFRFVPRLSPETEAGGAEADAESGFSIPEMPDWLSEEPGSLVGAQLPYRSPRRDIFAPVLETACESTGNGGRSGRREGLPRLSAVMHGKDGQLAVINDQIVQVGEMLGGYTVASIGQHRVVLTEGSKRLVLEVGE